jgi:ribosomal protein S18 acetylase RimI-like enzyme
VADRELRQLRHDESREAARLLARAFRDNPSSLALIHRRDAERRHRVLGRVFRGLVEATLRYGQVTAVSAEERLVGVSLVFAPDQYPYPPRAKAWMSVGPLSSGPLIAFRYGLVDAYLRRWHPNGPHHYLFVVGVDPDEQGRGHGGVLLGNLSDRADRDGLPCYLEADREDNVRLYERYGYRITKEAIARRLDNLRFWTMTRPVSP